MSKDDFNPIDLFSMYMKVTGVPTLAEFPSDDPALKGKKLGIIGLGAIGVMVRRGSLSGLTIWAARYSLA